MDLVVPWEVSWDSQERDRAEGGCVQRGREENNPNARRETQAEDEVGTIKGDLTYEVQGWVPTHVFESQSLWPPQQWLYA